MGAGKRVRVVLAGCAALIAAVVLAAPASADVEPNNHVFDAEGPIAGAQQISGTLGPGDVDDWYIAYVEGVQQLHLTGTIDGAAGCGKIELTDENGRALAPDYTSAAGITLFHVHVERGGPFCVPASSYSFQLDPAVAVVPGRGRLPVKGTAEPNDRRAEASGPLQAGAWYLGSLETANDHDWLRFYVRPNAERVKIAVVGYGNSDCPGSQIVSLVGSNGHELRSRSLGSGGEPVVRFDRDAIGERRLYVHSTAFGSKGCVGAVTAVQVGPEEAVMSRADVRSACVGARRAGRRAARRVATDRRLIAREGSRPALRRKLARHKRQLRSARRSVRDFCS